MRPFDLPAPRGFVGLPGDPRKDPVQLGPVRELGEALKERDALRPIIPTCEVFAARE